MKEVHPAAVIDSALHVPKRNNGEDLVSTNAINSSNSMFNGQSMMSLSSDLPPEDRNSAFISMAYTSSDMS